MARFTIIAALLVVLLAVAEGSIYRSIVTTSEIENESTGQRCAREMRGMRMNQCQQYLQQSMRGLMMDNPTRQVPQECCREMRAVSEECRCEAVRQMVQQMPQARGMPEVMQTASQLPSMCRMSPPYCDIRGRGYGY